MVLDPTKMADWQIAEEAEKSMKTVYQLGDELGVTRPNVTKLVDGLERCGMVERVPHPSDGRMVQACLTRRGKEVAHRALPGRARQMHAYWDALDDDELESLADLLERVGASTSDR